MNYSDAVISGTCLPDCKKYWKIAYIRPLLRRTNKEVHYTGEELGLGKWNLSVSIYCGETVDECFYHGAKVRPSYNESNMIS